MVRSRLDDEVIKEIWRDALHPRCEERDFPSEVYGELADYVGMPWKEIEKIGRESQRVLNYQWAAGSAQDPVAFYRQNRTYLYNLVHWHANYGEVEARVLIMQYLKDRSLMNVLDFGSGVGSTCILFAMNGFKVSAADIALPLLSFLEFRMRRRGLHCSLYNLNETEHLINTSMQLLQ